MYDNVFQLRNRMDKEIYDEIFIQNIYQLPDDMSGWAFIDIGAHIGAASYRAAMNGCRFIVAIEALWQNFYQYIKNASLFGENSDTVVDNCAVVGNTNTVEHLYLSALNDEQEGNQSTVWWEPTERSVPTITLSKVLEMRQRASLRKKLMLKIDVEGSEYDILMQSDLSSVDMIVGEVHSVPAGVWRDGREINKENLFEVLTSTGFTITILKQINEELTIFKATRKE